MPLPIHCHSRKPFRFDHCFEHIISWHHAHQHCRQLTRPAGTGANPATEVAKRKERADERFMASQMNYYAVSKMSLNCLLRLLCFIEVGLLCVSWACMGESAEGGGERGTIPQTLDTPTRRVQTPKLWARSLPICVDPHEGEDPWGVSLCLKDTLGSWRTLSEKKIGNKSTITIYKATTSYPSSISGISTYSLRESSWDMNISSSFLVLGEDTAALWL